MKLYKYYKFKTKKRKRYNYKILTYFINILIMDFSYTLDNYEEYFMNNFKEIFKSTIEFLLNNVNENTPKENLNKLYTLYPSLDYKKIILKIATKKTVFEKLNTIYEENNFKNFMKLKVSNEEIKKDWTIMPLFNIHFFMMSLQENERVKFYKLIKNLFICSFSYSKIVESDEKFNPSISIDNVATNFNINSFFDENDKYETPNSFDFVMNQLMENLFKGDEVKDKMETLNSSIENMDSNNLDMASNNIKNLLEEEGKTSANDMLCLMLDKVKNEIGNLKNNKNKSGNTMKDIMEIGKKISVDFKQDATRNNVNPFELIDSAFGIAEKATGNKNLNVVKKILKNNLAEKINNDIEKSIVEEINTTNTL